jgi:hypothetical protein
MSPSKERLEILEMVQNGTISAEEGARLIEAIGESEEALAEEYALAKGEVEGKFEPAETEAAIPEIDPEDLNKWKSWWIIPFWIGVAITVLGGTLMYLAWSARGISFGFFAAWIPFLLGVGLLVLGWNSRTGPWLHVRIQQKPGEKPERIAISFPLPNRFFAWIIRTFGSFIPEANLAGADQILLALGDYSQGDAPLSIDIEDDEDGDRVKVYIG